MGCLQESVGVSSTNGVANSYLVSAHMASRFPYQLRASHLNSRSFAISRPQALCSFRFLYVKPHDLAPRFRPPGRSALNSGGGMGYTRPTLGNAPESRYAVVHRFPLQGLAREEGVSGTAHRCRRLARRSQDGRLLGCAPDVPHRRLANELDRSCKEPALPAHAGRVRRTHKVAPSLSSVPRSPS